MAIIARKMIWIQSLILELNLFMSTWMPLQRDNQVVIFIAIKMKFHEHTDNMHI